MISVATKKMSAYSLDCTKAISLYCDKVARKYKKKLLDQHIQRLFSPVANTIEDLIQASPSTIELLASNYNGFNARKKKQVKKYLNLVPMYDNYISSKSIFKLNGSTYHARDTFNVLESPTCPYCNENFTYSFIKDKKSVRRTFEWDHFYPKDQYPFLAISLYNLIPACKTCNFLKLNDKNNLLNPFESFSTDKTIEFLIDIKKPDFISNENSYSIVPLPLKGPHHSKISQNIKQFAIEARYNARKDVVTDIFKKKQLYNHAYSAMLYKSFSGQLFKTSDEYKNLLVGAQLQETNYNKRPFSKIARDVFMSPAVK